MKNSEFTPLADSRLELRTARLHLRPTRLSDSSLLWPHVADPELSRWMTWDPHQDEGVTRVFLDSTVRDRLRGSSFAWVMLEEGQFRGFISLGSVQRVVMGVRLDKAELGYWVVRDHQGKGLMTEAASAVIAFGFRTLHLHKIWVRAMVPNVTSVRVIEKLGFTRVGLMRREVKRRGRWTDLVQWEMLGDDDAAKRLLRLNL